MMASRKSAVAPAPGDYIFVPPYVPHREENPDRDNPAVIVIARSTQEAIVINLPAAVGTLRRVRVTVRHIGMLHRQKSMRASVTGTRGRSEWSCAARYRGGAQAEGSR